MIINLPKPILMNIGIYLSVKDISKLFIMNKKLNNIFSNEYYWFLKFSYEFPNKLTFKDHTSWKHFFFKFNHQINKALDYMNISFDNLYIFLEQSPHLNDEMLTWFNQMFPDKEVYDYIFTIISSFFSLEVGYIFPILYGSGYNGKMTFQHFIEKTFQSNFDILLMYLVNYKLSHNNIVNYSKYKGLYACRKILPIESYDDNIIKIIPIKSQYIGYNKDYAHQYDYDPKFKTKCLKYCVHFLLFLLNYYPIYLRDGLHKEPMMIREATIKFLNNNN